MPARDANRGRGGGRGQMGSRQGTGGRDADAPQSAAGRGGTGAGTAGRAGQSQAAGARSGSSAERGAAAGSTQRAGSASASAQRGSGTSAPGTTQRSASATQGATGTPTTRGGATPSGAGASMGSDVNRRDMELGEAGAGRRSTAATSKPEAERERDIDTTREGGARAGSVGVGARGGAGGSAQVRSGSPEGGMAVSGRGQGRQGISPWFTGGENPFTMMRRMQDDLDRVFHAFGIPRFSASLAPARELEELLARSPTLTQAAHWSPQIEVFERDDSLVVRADLPGVRRDDVEVNVEQDVLTIRGQRRQEHREAEGGYRRTERSYGTFFRQIPLPDGVDASQIEASYEDGVLEVVVPTPREQPAGRRRIDIR